MPGRYMSYAGLLFRLNLENSSNNSMAISALDEAVYAHMWRGTLQGHQVPTFRSAAKLL